MKMSENKKNFRLFAGNQLRKAPSNYDREQANKIFDTIGLKKGETFVDLGCGTGNYSLHAAEIIGKDGKVFAIDSWEKMLELLNNRAQENGLTNLTTMENNICEKLTLTDKSVDVCFISNVLHGNKVNGKCKKLIPEITRILKPGGKLAIIEFKKEEMLFGPPLSIRIAPSELEMGIGSFGFQKTGFLDLGFHYMMLFES